MKIIVNHNKCTGCHLCELVCSLSHLGVLNTEKSAIRIQKDDLDASMNKPLVCLQCEDMHCLEGEVIDEDKAKHQFVWPNTRAGKCPFDRLTALGHETYHCDLCGGSPQCVGVCTSEAIRVKK